MVFTREQLQQLKDAKSKSKHVTKLPFCASTGTQPAHIEIDSKEQKAKLLKHVKELQIQQSIAKNFVNYMIVQNKNYCRVVKKAFERNKLVHTWLDYSQLHDHVKQMKVEKFSKERENDVNPRT